jgi:glutathione S-transferase
LPYRVVDAVPPRAPKGKLPYIIDDGKTIADSRFIIPYLEEQYGVDLEKGLGPSERAQSLAFQRMIEDDLHWAVMWSRWAQPQNWRENKQAIFGARPPGVRDLVARFARGQMRKQMRGQGIARNTESEIFLLAGKDLDALSGFLGDKPFFFGDAPTTLDASAFGFLTNIVWCPIESPLKSHAQGLGNLVSFCERIRDRYFEKDGDPGVTTDPRAG